MKLICLGDSLTFGYGVRLHQRWTTLIGEKTGWDVVNLGIPGDTTGGMLARLQVKIMPELAQYSFDTMPRVLVMGGGNDILYSGTDSIARANLGSILHQLLSAGVQPIALSPLPIAVQDVNSSWGRVVDFQASQALLIHYKQWMQHFCDAFGIPYIDLYDLFLQSDNSANPALFIDGLHPTPEGHQLIAGSICNHLIL